MGTTNLKKLALATVAGLGILAIAACGSSPLEPTDIGSGATLSAAPTAGTNGSATTSWKKGPRIQPNCAFGQELYLDVASVGKGLVEIASNYDLTERGCEGLAWSVDPALAYEAFTLGVDRVYVYLYQGATDPADGGFTVVATAPDGQTAKLSFDLTAKR